MFFAQTIYLFDRRRLHNSTKVVVRWLLLYTPLFLRGLFFILRYILSCLKCRIYIALTLNFQNMLEILWDTVCENGIVT